MDALATPNSWERRGLRTVFHGFSDLGTLRSNGPLVLTKGAGIYVTDVHGRSFLEANSGLWNMIAGFDQEGLIEAACDQVRRFPTYHGFFGRMTDVAVELAEKLVELAPFESGKVFVTNSSSEANDTVVKMLWLMHAGAGRSERRKILSRVDGYHGVIVATASMTGRSYNGAFGLPLPGFIHADCPHHWRYALEGESEEQFSQRLARNLEDLIAREGAETIAGFFAEPVIGAGGVLTPPVGYFEAIQEVLRTHDIPFVADEVVCGFGRTGRLWGCQTYGIDPDVVVASTCMTAGYFPMSAVIMSERFADRLTAACEAGEEFPHGFTASAHPVGCAVALKTIDLIVNQGLLARKIHEKLPPNSNNVL